MTRSRRVLIWLIAILLFYGVTELLVFTAFSLRTGRMFSFREMQTARDEWTLTTQQAFGMEYIPARYIIRKEVIHPYLGFVHDPAMEAVSPFGISDVLPIQARSADRVVIGFFGGSFAEDVVYHGADKMIEELTPLFPSREFVIVKAPLGGYKQPQQLMAFNYFTALGGEFDLVINLDGFNEIALPAIENVPATNPFFPRQWHLRTTMLPDIDLLSTVGEVRLLDNLSQSWARLFGRHLLRYSVTMNVVWRAGDRVLFNLATARRASLLGYPVDTEAFGATGPAVEFGDDMEMYAALGNVWAESSYQMNALAAARGARYFHILQPNQYVEGSKPMSAEERRVAIREDHPYATSVALGYPVLRELGRDLGRRGVHFVDLTTEFADNPAVLYRDNCCHVNSEGVDVIGAAIGRAVAAALRRESPERTGVSDR